jgi:hypothetical protein
VHGALGVGRQIGVVHVQAAGEHDAQAGDRVKGEFAAAEGVVNTDFTSITEKREDCNLLAVVICGDLLARGHVEAQYGAVREGVGL